MFSPHHLLSEDGMKQLMNRLQMWCLLMGLYHAVCEAVQRSDCRQQAKGNNWSLFLFQVYHQCQVLLNTLLHFSVALLALFPPHFSFPAPQREWNTAPWPCGFNILLCCSFPLLSERNHSISGWGVEVILPLLLNRKRITNKTGQNFYRLKIEKSWA